MRRRYPCRRISAAWLYPFRDYWWISEAAARVTLCCSCTLWSCVVSTDTCNFDTKGESRGSSCVISRSIARLSEMPLPNSVAIMWTLLLLYVLTNMHRQSTTIHKRWTIFTYEIKSLLLHSMSDSTTGNNNNNFLRYCLNINLVVEWFYEPFTFF